MTSWLTNPTPPKEKLSARDKLDRYYTPPWPTRALMEHLPAGWAGDCILEPCAGANGITDVLRACGETVITGDICSESVSRYGHDYQWDFVDPQDPIPQVTAIVSNPPFSKATPIVRNALAMCGRVAMLLRCTWVEPCIEKVEPWMGRNRIFADTPPHLLIVMPRVSFGRPRGSFHGQTDLATALWYVWGLDRDYCKVVWVDPADVSRLRGQGGLL